MMRSVELFTGAGGLALGISAAGFLHIQGGRGPGASSSSAAPWMRLERES